MQFDMDEDLSNFLWVLRLLPPRRAGELGVRERKQRREKMKDKANGVKGVN